MKSLKNQIAALIAPALLVMGVSCSNELDINSDWEAVVNVTGLLELNQDTQWVRVGRTYLGTQGFSGGANEPDSLYFENVTIEITEIGPGGQTLNTFPLERDNSSRQLNDGFFTTEGFRLYRFVAPLSIDNTYVLRISRPDMDEDVTSETNVVGSMTVLRPRGNEIFNFTSLNGVQIQHTSNTFQIYQGFLRFKYKEQNRNNPSEIAYKFLDFPLPTRNGTGGNLTSNVTYNSFFSFLSNRIPADNNVNRFYIGSDIHLVTGAEELSIFIRVNQPSNTLSQDRPEYTNIKNGIGIFSSRYKQIVSGDNVDGFEINGRTQDSLTISRLTCDLRFARIRLNPNLELDTCYCGDFLFQCP